MLAILAIVLLMLSLTLGYAAFLTQRPHAAAWDILCIAATLAFLGVIVRMVALRVERMVAEEEPASDTTAQAPALAPEERTPAENMKPDSPPGHRPLAPVVEYQCEESV